MFKPTKFLTGNRSSDTTKKKQWLAAQKGESEWWAGVASTGYDGQSTEEFVNDGQRKWLLSQLEFLGKPLDSWSEGTVVEFGPGPAGMVEYLEAELKIGVEPLFEDYKKKFPHLANSDVEYFACPAEEADYIPSNCADLVICFNVIDHTINPQKVAKQMARVAKDEADLLFQVNLYLNEEEMKNKSGIHAEMHPHSFVPETALMLMEAEGFKIVKHYVCQEANPCGEHFFICAGTISK